nr:acetyl/propionyl/methylcrotonyl-CoA carboxylase subunit alpha [Verticiella sp. GG226]
MLIANRGEIACRVAATARRLGVRTVAVYSDADAGARHVHACDEAVHLGPAPARESYLRADAIIAAARRTGAQAVHPGYGFLSENAGFAQACADAGLVFVGPPPSAIAAMGSKSAAKTLMAKAGVPLVPGYHGDDQDPARLRAEADAIGYPVLIKASAGGGGKGMRIVTAAGEFAAALASCQREASASFGDDHVLIERYVQKPRHIEVQVFADTHGNAVYLFERDCSVQRRHQKVIEEAPAPGMTAERRRAMGEAAVAAARAVGYVGAGTVEFIVEPGGQFYFMEMNTRLQVEHPVTEMICGQDLVEWQLRVAAGAPLPLGQEDLVIQGHAIEARLYAENPDTGFLPSVGTLTHLRLPPHVTFQVGADARGEPAAVRVDSGVGAGDTITPHYDPMIAKLIVWGADRDQARTRLHDALAATEVAGVHTNVTFLTRLMTDEAFAAADLDTGLIERRRETLLPPVAPASPAVLALAAAARLARRPATGTDPWDVADRWRVGGPAAESLAFLDGGAVRTVTVHSGHAAQIAVGDTPVDWRWSLREPVDGARLALAVRLADHETTGIVLETPDGLVVWHDGRRHVLELPRADGAVAEGHAGSLTAPMPGRILAVHVAAGDTVAAGQALMVMEAMKMEHTITAAADGEIAEVCFAPGDPVSEGAELLRMTDAAA